MGLEKLERLEKLENQLFFKIGLGKLENHLRVP